MEHPSRRSRTSGTVSVQLWITQEIEDLVDVAKWAMVLRRVNLGV